MSYAILGNSCHTNMNVLTDNTKYLSPDSRVYTEFITKMQLYPSQQKEPDPISYDIKYPEDIKNNMRDNMRKNENYSSCCGKK